MLPRLILSLSLSLTTHVQARKWTDASSKYALEADHIARSDAMAVLQREDRSLLSVNID